MSKSTLETKHFLIYGKVQSVGFREWLVKHAQKTGLTGSVENLEDGRVQAVVSGTPDQLKSLVRHLKKGPAQASVTRVKAKKIATETFQDFVKKRTKPASNSAETDIVSTLDPDYLKACQKAYDTLPASSRRMNFFEEMQGNWRFGQIGKSAEKSGVELTRLGPNAPPSLICRKENIEFGLDVTRPSWVSTLTEVLSNNKYLTKTLLESHKLPVPKGAICKTDKEAAAAFKDIDGKTVVKPVFGSESKGVTLNVSSLAHCSSAFAYAQDQGVNDLVLVEEYVPGVDLRLLLIGEKIVAAYLRLPANVVGNGKSTIEDLVLEKNAARKTLPSTKASQLIKLELRQHRLLTLQGYDAKDVPKSGQIVLLGVSPNYIDGADLVQITDQLHPEVADLARDTVAVIDPTGFWGLDLLTTDFTAPIAKAKTVVCEVNSRPAGGVFRYSTHGPHVPFFEAIFETVFNDAPTFLSKTIKPAKTIEQVPEPEASASFPKQVEDILASIYPDLIPIGSGVLVHGTKDSSEIFDPLTNSSFGRGALMPWRWKSLRQTLQEKGVRVTSHIPYKSGQNIAPKSDAPFGRAFLEMRRNKMKTLWVEDHEKLLQIEREHADWKITVEPFQGPSSIEVALIAGQAVALTQLEYQPLYADGSLTIGELFSAAIDMNSRSAFAQTREIRKILWRSKTLLPAGSAIPQPQAIARLNCNISTSDTIPADLKTASELVVSSLPGLTFGTLVFRPLEDGEWGLSEIRTGIDPRPFLAPNVGNPINLARIQAGYVIANSMSFHKGLAAHLMTSNYLEI